MLKGVQHPWAFLILLKTLCIFSKYKATLDKVFYESGQKCSKELRNHSFIPVEIIVVKNQTFGEFPCLLYPWDKKVGIFFWGGGKFPVENVGKSFEFLSSLLTYGIVHYGFQTDVAHSQTAMILSIVSNLTTFS